MRRPVIGIIALLLIGVAAALWMWTSEEGYAAIQAACLKVGVVMAVLWLAYDEVSRLPSWLGVAAPILLAVLVFRRAWLVVAVPVVIALLILKPRRRSPG